jgi:hypothetical protein
MTRRERLEAKAERRREWADKRRSRASAQLSSSPELRHDWAFITQPGHIPERERMNRADDRAMESLGVAKHHEAKATGLEDQLERCIFSDDDGAIDKIRERIAELDAKRASYVAVNAAWRKAGKPGGVVPFPAYCMTNLSGNARRLRERVKDIERRAARQAKAEAAGGVTVTRASGSDYGNITFAEKPSRAIIEALKAAGFMWGGGFWGGYFSKLPATCPTCPTSNGADLDLWAKIRG